MHSRMLRGAAASTLVENQHVSMSGELRNARNQRAIIAALHRYAMAMRKSSARLTQINSIETPHDDDHEIRPAWDRNARSAVLCGKQR